jgi:ribonuclease-3
VDAQGPDHQKVFTAQVRVGDEVLGEGSGRTKKEAEQAAARQAMENRAASRRLGRKSSGGARHTGRE